MVKILMPLCPGLKWLFMSSYTSDVIANNKISEVNFIHKPFSKRDLNAKISEVLKNNIAL